MPDRSRERLPPGSRTDERFRNRGRCGDRLEDMALFSRRKKSDDTDPASAEGVSAEESAAGETGAGSVAAASGIVAPDAAASLPEAPAVSISVQAFRGLGAAAGPAVEAPADPEGASTAPAAGADAPVAGVPTGTPLTPEDRKLPLAPLLPPPPAESMPGMKDNVLLRAALADLGEKPTNIQMLGVLRQALQGQLYIRVQGDPRTQAAGTPLAVGVIREGERTFLLAFTSLVSLRDSVQRETDPQATSAAAQPATELLKQVIGGGFDGLIIDNAEPVHRAAFPTPVLKQALEHADPAMTVKGILAEPHTEESPARLAEALASTNLWVALGEAQEGAPAGIAEARLPSGQRFLQVFSHPLEVIALGRGERPMPFTPAQLSKVFAGNPELAGVLVDFAGPSMLLPRGVIVPALERAVPSADQAEPAGPADEADPTDEVA